MDEELKLFGEVGIGYSQLKQDSENISKIFDKMSQDAKNYGKIMQELTKGTPQSSLFNISEIEQAKKGIQDITISAKEMRETFSNATKNLSLKELQSLEKEMAKIETNTERAKTGFKGLEEIGKKNGQAFSELAVIQKAYSEAEANNAKLTVNRTKKGIQTIYDYIDAEKIELK